MNDYVTYTADQCLKQETLFLVVIREDTWISGSGRVPVGTIVKIDLRPYGRSGQDYSYYTAEYREASGAEKLLVISGKRDVIIVRK
jgi:hypothetical protein